MTDSTASKRIGLSKKRRFEIFKRDGFICQYCGRKPPDVVLQVDHIVAVAQGGENEEHNLITACFDCNAGKSSRSLESSVILKIDLEQKRHLIEERREQVAAYDQALSDERNEMEARIDSVIAVYDYMFENIERFDFNRTSIRNFLRKLPTTEVQDAMEMACERMQAGKVFKYFCGICWNKIRGPKDG